MRVCVDLTRYGFFRNLFPTAHCPTSKSKWPYYVYWVACKITIFCSSLLETGMLYTTYINGVDDSFNNKSQNLAGPFYGNDTRVREIEQHWKRVKCSKVKGGATHKFIKQQMFWFILISCLAGQISVYNHVSILMKCDIFNFLIF